MKYDDIISKNQTPEIIDEVKMSTSVFDSFIASDAAEGILCGFEAELIFRGAAEEGYSEIDYDAEPEMDESEDRRPRDIEDICDFFDDGDHNDRRDIQKLREQLTEAYDEWRFEGLSEGWAEVEESEVKDYIEENDWDYDAAIEEYLRDELELSEKNVDEAIEAGKEYSRMTSVKAQNELKDGDMAVQWYAEAADHANEMLDEKVADSIREHDSNYESARDNWEEYHSDDYTEDDWLRRQGLRWMTDVYREYDIRWPYWEYPEREIEGGYTEDAAQRIANTLEDDLDVKVHVSGGYHQTKRKPNLWIMEPDGSLEPDDEDDLPAEIVSPPMDLPACLETIPRFFEWAKSNDAYSNETTGFHVGVSLPYEGGRIDYLKLALFLGDQHVLDKFDRSANYFTKSAMSKIRAQISNGDIDQEKVESTLKLMRHDLIELANKTITGEKGHGKYTSINLKGDYIEFRSMGSEKYFSDPKSLERVLDTIKRYSYAMYIASRPDMFRDEYAKKLYKLLDKEGNSAEAMKEFSDYVTAVGGADPHTVKNFILVMKSEKYKDAPLPDRKSPVRDVAKSPTGKYWWNVQWGALKRMEVVAKNKADAIEVARREWDVTFRQAPDSDLRVTALRPYKDAAGGVGNFAIISGGNQVFRITASNQGEANRLAREWLAGRSEEYRREHQGEEVEVVPLTQ